MSNYKGVWYPTYDGYGEYPSENEIKTTKRIEKILMITMLILIMTILLFVVNFPTL